jgi:hypothetical protein
VLDVPAAGLAAKLQSKLQAPSKSEESEADDVVETEPPKTEMQGSHAAEPSELSKTISQNSEVASDITSEFSKTLSQAKEAATSIITEGKEAVSGILGPDDALVSETVPGSVDAPGAFPGMDGSDEATGGVSIEQPSPAQEPIAVESSMEKPTIEHAPTETKLGGNIEAELEKKKEEAPSTAGTAPANEGAGSTQAFTG